MARITALSALGTPGRKSLIVADSPAVADFEWYVRDLTVSFFENVDDPDDSTAGRAGTAIAYVNTFLWDFGDGNTSTERHPQHTYAAANTYDVTLTAWSPAQVSCTITQSVVVAAIANHAPFASFTYSINGLVVTFTDTSEDDDGTIASWSWNFGDAATSTSQNPSRTYAAAGVYTVTLTVTDDDAATNAGTQTFPIGTAIGNYPVPQDNWPMPGANVQRTGWNSQEAWDAEPGMTVRWYAGIADYVPYFWSPLIVDDVLFMATHAGIHAIDISLANEGDELWTYPMAMPPGHMPTYYAGYLYIPGTDSRLHTINATTGAFVRSYATTGMITSNPLVLDSNNSSATQPIAIFTCRDGKVYGVYAEGAPSPGTLAWSTDIGVPISHTPAYYSDHIYFGARNSVFYKLAIDDGAIIDQSATQPGFGANAFWPVVYHHASGTRIISSTGSMQRTGHSSGGLPGKGGAGAMSALMYSTLGYANLEYLGKVLTPPTDGGVSYLDASDVVDWFTSGEPVNDRTTVSLFASTMETAEILPLLWAAGTGSGYRAPGVISAAGDLYFSSSIRATTANIPESAIMRWTPDSPTRLWFPGINSITLEANDEPRAMAIGGRYIQFQGLGAREIVSMNVAVFASAMHNRSTHPQKSGDPGMAWIAPNYIEGGGMAGSDTYGEGNFEAYGGLNGIYGTHGVPGAPIPHRGRLYAVIENTLCCWTPGNHKPGLQKATIAAIDTSLAVVQPPTISTATITTKLETHVQGILDVYDANPGVMARFLQPSYIPHGLPANELNFTNAHMIDYFGRPFETVYALLRAYPYVNVTMQGEISDYIDDFYAAFFYTTSTANAREYTAWDGLSDRSYNLLYPDRLDLDTFTTSQATRTFQPDNWGVPNSGTTIPTIWTKNPFGLYVLWMIHDVLGTSASTLLTQAHASLLDRANPVNIANDGNLLVAPYVLNAFISGYIGFINLKAAASQSLTNGEQAELDRLKALRRDNFTANTSFGDMPGMHMYGQGDSGAQPKRRLRIVNIAFKFLWMCPELWEYLMDEIPSQVEDVVEEMQRVAPYWPAKLFPLGYNEDGQQNFLNSNLMIEAYGAASLMNQQELAARIDAPELKIGDLDYIHSLSTALEAPPGATISIGTVVDAVTTYNNGGSTERKVTVTATVTTEATEPWFEYAASPPTGVVAGTGCTVNLIVQAPDNTTYTVPMYWVQEWTHTTHTDSLAANANRDHFLPAADVYAGTTHTYKGHFTPSATGDWDYYVQASDANGSDTSATDIVNITAVGAGAIIVSPTDTRYFQYERSGNPFLAFGYNQDGVNKIIDDPTVYGAPQIEAATDAGVSFVRFWLSYGSIYGTQQNPVATRLPPTDPPQDVIRNNVTKADRAFFWQIQPVDTAEAFHTNGIAIGLDDQQKRLAAEPSTTYEVKITYQLNDTLTVNGAGDFGLVIKTMTTIPNQADFVSNAVGTPISSHVTVGSSGVWTTLAGNYTTAAGQWYLPYILIGLENCDIYDPDVVTTNRVYISDIEIRKDGTGPNIFNRFKADMHRFFDQRRSAAFDLALAACEANGLYLSLVLLEKNASIFPRLNTDGTTVVGSGADSDYFYGNSTDVDHHGRWHQKQWFRYAQARWGYSTAIHSWELLNEGELLNRHYRLADVLAGYINQWTLNRHLVTTSFFTHRTYPRADFWNSATYTNISAGGYAFAKTHDYIESTETGEYDEAVAIASLESIFVTLPGFPVGSGETDWATAGVAEARIDATTNEVWLHNYTWSQLRGKLAFVLPFFIPQHIMPSGSDQRDIFGAVRAFLAGLPLSNGEYADIAVTATDLNVVGQKDVTNGTAYLWVQAHGTNPYTWKSIDDGLTITPVTEDITIAGLAAGQDYIVTEYSVLTGAATANTDTLTADGSGVLTIPASSFVSLTGLNDTAAFQVEETAGQSYTLVADTGTYTLTGQAAALTVSRVLTAEQGTLTLTGQDAALVVSRRLVAETGMYVLSGQDAVLVTGDEEVSTARQTRLSMGIGLGL